MSGVASGFDRDAANRAKCQKHGVSIADIEALLLENPKVSPDLRHSGSEERLVAVGRNQMGRAVFVVFTFRLKHGKRLIRRLSARYMHRKEIEGYEKEDS